MADIPFLSTHRQTPIYTHPRSAPRKITAVGEGLCPFGNKIPRELVRRTAKLHESPCFCARAPKSRGIQAYLIGSAHLRLQSANAPSLRRIPKEPAPQSRFLRAAFFPSAFFAEACYHIKCNSKKNKKYRLQSSQGVK